jgi:predicted HicB family RNase H-like nuclease
LEKAELERLRDEAVDWRGRNAANMDQIQKLKKEGSDLARDVLVLHEENAKLSNEV